MRLFNRNPLDWDTLSPLLRGLLIVNLAVFLLQWTVGYPLIELFGLIPYRVTQNFWLWQLVTYMFLHGGILHLFFNMLMLWMFGNVIEAQWGAREFVKYYFLCGLGAALVSIAFGWDSSIPTIGASGAIFGLLVAFAMIFPDAVVYVWFFIPMRARTMAIVFGVLELMMTMGHRPGIAGFAHIGGMLTGYIYLKFGWQLSSKTRYWSKVLSGALGLSRRPRPRRRKRAGRGGEDLENEVNRILDKVLVQGAESLTPEEKEIMRRYSKKPESG